MSMFSISQCNSYVYLPIFPMNPYISTVHILSSISGEFGTLFLRTYTDTFLVIIVVLLPSFSAFMYLLNLLISHRPTSPFLPHSPNVLSSSLSIHTKLLLCKANTLLHQWKKHKHDLLLRKHFHITNLHATISWIPFSEDRHTSNLENIRGSAYKFNISTYQPSLLTCWNNFNLFIYCLPVFNVILMYIFLSFSWIPIFQQFVFSLPFPYFQHFCPYKTTVEES